MTARQAFNLLDRVIAQASNLPTSYVVVNEAVTTLSKAMDRLEELESLQEEVNDSKKVDFPKDIAS